MRCTPFAPRTPPCTAWALAQRARAAELLLYLPSDDWVWKAADAAAFKATVQASVVPLVINGSRASGDVELSMIEAMAAAAVLTDDPALLTRGLAFLRDRLPAFVYVEALDGRAPRPPPMERATRMFLPAQSWCVSRVCRRPVTPRPSINSRSSASCRNHATGPVSLCLIRR